MSWTSPRTWSACEVVTAAIMNTHVRDNLNQTLPGLVTTKGDAVYATGANAGQRVGVSGTNGAVMIAMSTCNAGVTYNVSVGSPIITQGVIAGDTSLNSPSSACNAGLLFYRTAANNWGGTGTYANGDQWYRAGAHIFFGGGANSTCPTPTAFFNNKLLFIGNSGFANANMTYGLTIGGSVTPESITLKRGDVNHGMTGITETDTFGFLRGSGGGNGGLDIYGLSDGNSAAKTGLLLAGLTVNAADTTKSVLATGQITLYAGVKSGTANVPTASTGNMVTIQNSGSTRFIFQGGGDLYADSGLTASAFDSQDDVQMVRALEVERNPGSVIRDHFDSWLKYNRKDLEAANIAAFNDPAEGGDGSVFVNVMGLQRLHSGAIWQTHKYVRQLEARIVQLERLLIGPPRAGAA